MSPSWHRYQYLTSSLSILPEVAHWYAMRSGRNAKWEPTVPALVNLVAASRAPGLRAAFAAAGLDGIRPAQAVALVPLAAGGLHASDLADRLNVTRQAAAQAVAVLERHDYVVRGPHPSDARARIIKLTPRGRQALRVMRSNALDVEEHWRDVLGEHRFGELRETLLALLSAEAGEAQAGETRPTAGPNRRVGPT
jgi:DNA-binding MarR family transcriptional regulator